MSQHDEDRKWSLYLASMANPLSEPQSFNDFLMRIEKKKTPETTEIKAQPNNMTNLQIAIQIDKSNAILSRFDPQLERG